MSITSSVMTNMDQLLATWRQDDQDFVCDGIVDSSQFFTEKVKLLFVLKEADKGVGTDLRAYLRESSEITTQNLTWLRAAKWTDGIINFFEYNRLFTWHQLTEEYLKNPAEYYKKWLSKVSVVNLKKTPPKGPSRLEDIKAYSEDPLNREYLKKQFELIDPDIIILASEVVESLYRELSSDSLPLNVVVTPHVKGWIEGETNCLVLSTYHLSDTLCDEPNEVEHQLWYRDMMEVLSRLGRNG